MSSCGESVNVSEEAACSFAPNTPHLKSSKRKALEQKKVDEFIRSGVREKIDILTLSTLPSSFLESIRPDEVGVTQWRDSCRWVVHSILTGIQQKRFKQNSFISLSSIALKNILGNRYRTYIRELINVGILGSDGRYSTKYGESLGYMIADEYLQGKIVHRTIQDKDVAEGVIRHRRKKAQETREKSKRLLPLTRWLTRDTLSFDKEEATDFMGTYGRMLRREVEKRELKPSIKLQLETFLEIRMKLMETTISNWTIAKPFTIDNSGGRLYTSLTNMPSILRNFVKADTGEELVSIDIKNSQPFHMLFMLQREFWLGRSKGVTLYGLDRELFTHLKGPSRSLSPLIMFHREPETLMGQGFSDFSFRNLVVQGKLYEFISDQFRGRFVSGKGSDRFATRHLTKGAFMHLMYYDPRKVNPTIVSVFNAFREMFPREAAIMETLKDREFRDFPILLQKIEVKMLLEVVAGAIHDADPEIPLYSIHDSLATTASHMPVVREILNREYTRVLGLSPRLEEKRWSPHNAYMELRQYVKNKVDEARIETGVRGEISESSLSTHDSTRKLLLSQLPQFVQYPVRQGIPGRSWRNPFTRRLKTDPAT